MATIKRIRTLKDAGILADKRANDHWPDFLRFNLIYGFNGSGKSTLSRIFASLQEGKRHELLPDSAEFEVEADDGTIYRTPNDLHGVERQVCVFNRDFIEKNLQWEEGRAKSIFYISQEQADLVAELRASEVRLAELGKSKIAQQKLSAVHDKALKTYRTARAQVVASSLHLGSRRYEAGHLRNDYEKLEYNKSSVLSPEQLNAFEDVARLSAPLASLAEISVDLEVIPKQIELARVFSNRDVGAVLLEELRAHPFMLEWAKVGYDYHEEHDLEFCLLCGSEFSRDRRSALSAMLNGKVGEFLETLKELSGQIEISKQAVSRVIASCPKAIEVDPWIRDGYEVTREDLLKSIASLEGFLKEASRIIGVRLENIVDPVGTFLPTEDIVLARYSETKSAISLLNNLIGRHNSGVEDFESKQRTARDAIKRHFLAEGDVENKSLKDALDDSVKKAVEIEDEVVQVQSEIESLKAKVRTHGPAAERITALVRAYLGHGELTLVAADTGYELHRYGSLVRGAPSEGEKTAIALCYYLTTLGEEGRDVRNVVAIVDDPISSLDTKAMNYACSLIRHRLKDVAQLYLMTHNQHCMNEFRKAWGGLAEPKNPETEPSARRLFIDVTMPAGANRRVSRLVDMPPLLRAYDSEYHFLCQKVLEFEAAGEGHSDYGFMMPNVIRRVLEIFLAFKVPGSNPIKDKLAALCKQHKELDPERLSALERLSQVESHSDNLDDLISLSSATVEEARSANAELLNLMKVADESHTMAIRRQCRVKT
ncbi:MAG: AAA family ATPase [Kiloniellaceae bacterium]